MTRTDTPGDQLLQLCREARSTLVLCAPFAKCSVIARALAEVEGDVRVELFTRWRPEEVAAGVSDTAVLDLVVAHGGAVYLCDRLHAKFYRCETKALVGSANLTATALGWVEQPNLELLLRVQRDEVAGLERVLRSEALLATKETAEEV